MGRANRLTVAGGIFHVTHRCHDQAYLLKFARDRDSYRNRLRQGLAEFSVSLLDYTVTSNHVHLLVDAQEKGQVSGLMRKVAGEFAREYNRRKDRRNAFWGDNLHATLVEEGQYLYGCLLYVELNMVRCGAVRHPREWQWVGYHEIMPYRFKTAPKSASNSLICRQILLIHLNDNQLCWRHQTNYQRSQCRPHCSPKCGEASSRSTKRS